MTTETDAGVAGSRARQDPEDKEWVSSSVLFAIVFGGVVGYFLGLHYTSSNMILQAQERADRGHALGMVKVRALVAQKNPPSFDVRDINCDILKLQATSREIGQRPDTLESSGIKTVDMPGGAVCPAKPRESRKVANYPD